MESALIIDLVRTIRLRQQRVGTRKLLEMLSLPLTQHGIKIGRDKLFDLLASHQLLIRKRKRKRPATTDSNHPFRKYPNMIKELPVSHANQLWVSDITYLSLSGSRFCYLSLVTDVYSRKIIGHCLHPTLKKEGPLQALRMALSTRNGSVFYKTIHHSDRGIQYCSHDYIKELEASGISISMTENGDPGENAIAERVNGILKTEFLLDQQFSSYKQALTAVEAAIRTYNEDRLHMSRNNLTPDQVYRQASGEIAARWKPRKKPSVNQLQDHGSPLST